MLNELNSNVLRLPSTKKNLQPYLLQDRFNVGGKARNISIQLVLHQCFKTSCTFFVVAHFHFLNHVKQFQDIDSLLLIVKFGCDETAENSSEFNRASWHKSCYAKFSSCNLERAKLKRKHSSSTAA